MAIPREDYRRHFDESSSCPRSTLSFVGRDAELARIAELFDEDVLFLIYGVAGIGKTELAYRALELAQTRPGWSRAVPTLIQVQPDMTVPHLLAVLRQRTGADAARPDHLGARSSSLAEELDAVSRALDAQPRLLFLDDVHLIDPAPMARILGHLARCVRASRVFAASRLEVPLASLGITPVITRLAPLDDRAARDMITHLGRRLGIAVSDVTGILQRAGGSPFFLQREVVSSPADELQTAGDRLIATLAALPEPARRLLLHVAVVPGRVSVSELEQGAGAAGGPLAILARHFFLDAANGAIAIHDLIREAVLRLATPSEIQSARQAAAEVFVRRTDAGGPEAPLAAVEAARQLCAAGDHAASLAFITERYRLISGAGVDHLLRDTLDELRVALPGQATSIDLQLARTMVRRGMIAAAQDVLTRVTADPAARGSVRYLTLAGTIASQRGDLRTAEVCLQGAHDAASPDTAGGAERLRVALHLADVLALRGETLRARAILAEVRPICDALGTRTVLRWGWSMGLSWLLDEEFTEVIATVAPLRDLAMAHGMADLAVQLTMLEVLSHAELHDAAQARALTDRIVAPAARAGALRAPIASFYMGTAAWAEGDLAVAEPALREAWSFLCSHNHEVLGLIAGHYLARAQLMRGDVVSAVELLARSTRRAIEIGLDGIRAYGEVHHAYALAVAGELGTASAVAGQALARTAAPGRGPQANIRMVAHQVMALGSAHAGALAEARAHVDHALSHAGDLAGPRCDTLLVSAEVELCGGDPAVAVQAARGARTYYATSGRRFSEARACVALAGGHAALGGPGDLAMAEESLARGTTLAERHGYEELRLRGVLVKAAVLVRLGQRADADPLLASALTHDPRRPAWLELLLASALGSRRDRELPAGLAAQLALLGLSSAPAPAPEVVVDVTGATIATRDAVVKGRPIACALLACLADAQGQVVPAEALYREAWGASEYHPLRHRNTLYVAINRLRGVLATLCPDRHGELIETLPGGWRLVAGVVARKTS